MTDTSSFQALLAQSSQQGFTLNTLLFFALLMVGMYFLMIAPQRKKEKEHKKMLAALKTGDKVITIGGIFGTITAIKEDRYHVKVDDSTRLEVLKSAIQTRPSDPAAIEKK